MTYECHKLDTEREVLFYENDFYPLSNFSAFAMHWKGLRFDTSEAVYHWEKFHDTAPDIAEAIRRELSAHEAFKLAQQHADKQRSDWKLVRVDVMRDILRAKLAQHAYVRHKLAQTGDRELIEDSWRDPFWGWGKHRNGQNMLGKLWMEVRAEFLAADTQNAATKGS